MAVFSKIRMGVRFDACTLPVFSVAQEGGGAGNVVVSGGVGLRRDLAQSWNLNFWGLP